MLLTSACISRHVYAGIGQASMQLPTALEPRALPRRDTSRKRAATRQQAKGHCLVRFVFFEFEDFLGLESAWVTIGTLRTGVAKNIKGGMINVVRQLLRAMFLGATSLSHGGLALGNDVGIFRSLPSVAER